MSVDGNLVSVEDVKIYFPIKSGLVLDRHVGDIKAVDGVSFEIERGETLGLVGESGCGKSTVGRAMLRLYELTRGQDRLRRAGHLEASETSPPAAPADADGLPGSVLVAQPRHSVARMIAEPMRVHGLAGRRAASSAFASFRRSSGSPPTRPRAIRIEFSGGQRQRIGLARSLALNPDLIVADEPVSALDASIQAQIINLLENLQHEFDLTYLFIAHDLAVVRHISDRIAVMYLGTIVEVSPADELYDNPLHPYTITLLGRADPRS